MDTLPDKFDNITTIHIQSNNLLKQVDMLMNENKKIYYPPEIILNKQGFFSFLGT